MKVLVVTILLFCFFFLPVSSFAENLLLNSSFEESTGGIPIFWTKNVSTATFEASNTTKSGTQSASINKTNNSTGLIYAYQDVDIDTSSFYSLSGYAIKNDPKFSWIILRISWRDSSSEISKTDSSQLTLDSTDFQQIKIDSVQPPSQAIKARIELAANIISQNPNNPAVFDDISFSQVETPNQPTSAPTSTPTPTATKTPTPTLTPTQTIVPVVTTPILTTNFASQSAQEILGESSASAEERVTEIPKKTKINSDNFNFLPFIFVIIGSIAVLIPAAILYPNIKKIIIKDYEKYNE